MQQQHRRPSRLSGPPVLQSLWLLPASSLARCRSTIAAAERSLRLCLLRRLVYIQQLTEPHFLIALGLQFTGSLLVPKSGPYTFRLGSLRRARLWLDDYLLMDQVSCWLQQGWPAWPGGDPGWQRHLMCHWLGRAF